MTRTQWLDLSSLEMANLIGKNVLIVDEVDDTRTTLEYAVRELEKDVEAAVKKLGREGEKTNFSIFVLHNKDKAKKGALPQEILKGRYSAARTVGDVWICYPWEATYVSLFLTPFLSLMFCANVVSVILKSTIVSPGSRRASNRVVPLKKDRRDDRREITTSMKEKSMRDIYGILSIAFNGRMGYTGV